MNSLLYSTFGRGTLSLLIVCMSICNTPVISVAESVDQQESAPAASDSSMADLVGQQYLAQITSELSVSESAAQETNPSEFSDDVRSVFTEQKKTKVEEKDKPETNTLEETPFVPSEPSVEVESGMDGMTMLYIGGAIGVVALGVAALAGGGGSSDSDGSLPGLPAPTAAPIGPDLNGVDWTGFLNIKDHLHDGIQNIAANISHSGSSVYIVTTSTLDYGRQFSGSITASGYMMMNDATTGQVWTTHYGNARTDSVDLYDFVENFTLLDRMYLSR